MSRTGALLGFLVLLMGGAAAHARDAGGAYLRVNQLGYETGRLARAYLVTDAGVAGARFEVRDDAGHTVASGPVEAPVGRWGDFVVTKLDFTIGREGRYGLSVDGVPAPRARVLVGDPGRLYDGALRNALAFFQTQRDGPDFVPNDLRAAPGHLNDRQASVYVTPPLNKNGKVIGDLTPTGEVIDASGGWADAGDYMKFVQTTSFVVGVMLTGVRDFPGEMGARGPADFTAEAKFGLNWLRRMWNDRTRTFYYQVELGQDFVGKTILSDHDLWRLPQADDTLGAGDPNYALINHRPVFVAGPAGSPISPNLAGRMSAVFALCFQHFRRSDPALAGECLMSAEHIFELADTHPTTLLTALPYDYYPETEWRDDMEWGATELSIALATANGATPAGLPHDGAGYYLKQAATWARAYIDGPGDGTDTLNLYDVSGLAHYQLYRAINLEGRPAGLAVSQAELMADLRQQLAIGTDRAMLDPFGFGGAWTEADSASHGAGLVVTAQEVADLDGDHFWDGWSRTWLGNLVGANIWGVSMIIGDGNNPPQCPQHQVANLVGSLHGDGRILRGAVVEGPNAPDSVARGFLTGMRACPTDGVDQYQTFTGNGARFRDNVQNYVNTEPAIDLTALSPLMFSWRTAGRARPLGE